MWHFATVRSCDIHKTLNAEQFLRIERSQLRWFGHVSRMSHNDRRSIFLLATPTGKWPRGRPRTKWSDYISDLARSCLVVEGTKLTVVQCFNNIPCFSPLRTSYDQVYNKATPLLKENSGCHCFPPSLLK